MANRKNLTHKKCERFIDSFLLSCAYDFLITESAMHLTFCISPCCGTKNKKPLPTHWRILWNRLVIPAYSRRISPARRARDVFLKANGVKPSKFDSTDTGWVIMISGWRSAQGSFSSCRGWPDDGTLGLFTLFVHLAYVCTCSSGCLLAGGIWE